MSQLFTSGGQSIGVSASASDIPMNIQGWSPLGWTGWISLQSKELSRGFSSSTVWRHQVSLWHLDYSLVPAGSVVVERRRLVTPVLLSAAHRRRQAQLLPGLPDGGLRWPGAAHPEPAGAAVHPEPDGAGHHGPHHQLRQPAGDLRAAAEQAHGVAGPEGQDQGAGRASEWCAAMAMRVKSVCAGFLYRRTVSVSLSRSRLQKRGFTWNLITRWGYHYCEHIATIINNATLEILTLFYKFLEKC